MIWILAIATALFFYYGFLVSDQSYTYRLKGGFLIFASLLGLQGYFVWKEGRSLKELSTLIVPIPKISDVTYVPNFGEMQAFANFAASAPGHRRTGTKQAERQAFADSLAPDETRYWILATSLSPEEVTFFYRDSDNLGDWSVEFDEPPWLALKRGTENLKLFARKDWTETEVLVRLPAALKITWPF